MHSISTTLRRVVFLFFYSSVASAQLMENLPVGNAKALALGNAVTADPVGIDSIHFNPAGLIKIRKSQYHFNFIAGGFFSTTHFGSRAPEFSNLFNDVPLEKDSTRAAFEDPIANTTSNLKGTEVYVPYIGVLKAPLLVGGTGGVAIKVPDQEWVFATSIYAPLGGGYYRDSHDPGKYEAQELGVTKLTYFSPTVAFELLNNFYVGVSLGVSTLGARITLPFRLPNLALINLRQIGDRINTSQCNANAAFNLLCSSFGPYEEIVDVMLDYRAPFVPSVNLGLLWDVQPWLTFGAVYRSKTQVEWKGEYSATYTDAYKRTMAPVADLVDMLGISTGKDDSGHSTLKTALPGDYAVGVSLKLTPKLKFNVDRHWAMDSVWQNVDLQLNPALGFLKVASLLQPQVIHQESITLPFNFSDTVNWAVGVEYQWDTRLALRMGFEPRESSTEKDRKNIIVPLDKANTYSVGFEYKLNDSKTIEGVFSLTKSTYSIENGPGQQSKLFNYYDNPVSNVVLNPYAGLPASVHTSAIIVGIGYTQNF